MLIHLGYIHTSVFQVAAGFSQYIEILVDIIY